MKWLVAVVIFLALVISFVIYPYKNVVFSGPEEGKLVALTFDDGPNEGETMALLEALDSLGIKATFFLKGANVNAYPELAAAIVQRGHQVGNHSYSHGFFFGLDQAAMAEEISRTSDAILQAAGCRVDSFRSPHFAQGFGLMWALEAAGLPSIGASVAANDWEDQDPELLASRIIDGAAPGSLLLLHDGDGDAVDPAQQPGRWGSVAAVPLVVAELQQQGYQFVTVNTLLGRNGDAVSSCN
jgi:peptidoglycan/xylan/chitin deacetylase (PgdA/CDA1 family)